MHRKVHVHTHACAHTYVLIRQELKTGKERNGDGRWERDWREGTERRGEGEGRRREENKPLQDCVIKILCSRPEAVLGDPTQKELVE